MRQNQMKKNTKQENSTSNAMAGLTYDSDGMLMVQKQLIFANGLNDFVFVAPVQISTTRSCQPL